MANINKTPWEVGMVLVCTKCGAKFNNPNIAEEVKTEIRKIQKEQETLGKIRVIPSGCLGVCYPEKQTFSYQPIDGKTEVYTTDLNKESVLSEIDNLIKNKLKS